MFIDFFYTLRAYGLDVSLDEWLCLMDALDQGLAENSLLEFYYLCRNVLVKSESDYDTLDQAFGAYFQGIETIDDIPDELKQWLAEDGLERDLEDMPDWAKEYDMDTLRKMFAERLAEQNERHNGLLRRFLPKGTALEPHTADDLFLIADEINRLPRRRLDYRTPDELFENELDNIYNIQLDKLTPTGCSICNCN